MKENKEHIVSKEVSLDRPHRLGKAARTRLDSVADRDIDYSDIPDTSELWKTLNPVMPEPKQQVTLRIDKDVLEFFKEQGNRYQTRMNAVLRAYALAHKH